MRRSTIEDPPPTRVEAPSRGLSGDVRGDFPDDSPGDLPGDFPGLFLWGADATTYESAEVSNAALGDRFDQDVAGVCSLGLDAYRFAASWSRVRPGAGPVSREGLDVYDRLTDALLAAGITPWITLHHRDLPPALADQGGWTNRDTAYRFLDHALAMYDALGDRIPRWTTLHEPGHEAFGGVAEPGSGLVAAHHLLLAHGLAVQELRRRGATPQQGRHLGITLNLTATAAVDVGEPRDPVDVGEPRDTARRHDGLLDRVFLEPLLHGRYGDDPAVVLGDAGTRSGRPWQESVLDGDRALIAQPIDFLGVRCDAATALRAGPDGGRTGSLGPSGLTRVLILLRDQYAVPPLYVTTGGAAYHDPTDADGTIDDRSRLESLREHLIAIHDALDAAVDVRGAVARSLLDEPSRAARWYADVAATGRI